MSKSKRILLLLSALLLFMPVAMAQAPWAQPTPGGTAEIERISEACPTFRWEPMPNASALELVVYEIGDGESPDTIATRRAGDRRSRTAPTLRQALPAGVSSWTPPAITCLDAGQDYVWYVRETDALGRATGTWSDGLAFRVAAPGSHVDLAARRQPAADRDLPPAGGDGGAGPGNGNGGGTGNAGNNGNGTGGIPAVLQALEMLEQQISDQNDDVNARFDALEAQIMANQMQLDEIDERVRSHHQSTLPCTPERWRQDRCAEQDSPLQVDSTYCFKMALGAEMEAGYEVKPSVEVELGPGWDNVADATVHANIEFPAVVGGFLPVPSLQLELDAGIGGELEFCFSGLSFDGGAIGQGRAPDEFIELLVSSIESRRDEIVERAAMFAGERNLTPDRLVDALDTLRELRTDSFEGEPLAAFGQGPVRELIAGVVDDARVLELIDNPGELVPTFDRGNPLAFCETISTMPLLAEKVGSVCNFVAEDMPDLVEVADKIENLPLVVADQLCESIPGLDCSADGLNNIRQCRRSCRSDNRNCKSNCGIFEFSCRRSCEQTKNSCINSCS